jgi:ubiquinone/menaquinone biosynthesis C-methylase UbiE
MGTFEKEWQGRFERFAQCYEADHLVSGWSDSGMRRRLTLFNELLRGRELPPPARILDLGCGGGTYVRLLSGLGHWVVGLDYSLPSLYRACTADVKWAGHYAAGEAYNLPFFDEHFDMVVSIGVLQALNRPERALDEIGRVLRHKGLLILEFLNAFEVVALVKSAYAWLGGRLPRVQTFSRFQVSRWLVQRGFRLLQCAAVYLPPRRLPWIEGIFSRKGVVSLMEGVPGCSLVAAHAFLLVAEKEATGLGSR